MQSETKIRPPDLDGSARPTEAGRGYLFGGVALASIWASVVLMAVLAPDLVTGSQQEHFPLAMVVGLLAGLAATRSVVRVSTRMGPVSRSVWLGYVLVVGGIWLGVALAAIFVPVTVSGADPTQLPIAVIVAPIGGAILTGAVTEMFTAGRR